MFFFRSCTDVAFKTGEKSFSFLGKTLGRKDFEKFFFGDVRS